MSHTSSAAPNQAFSLPQDLRERRKWKYLFRYETGRKDKDTPIEEHKDQAKAKVTMKSLKRFWSFVYPHRHLVYLLCAITILNQAMTVVMPVAIGRILDDVLPSKDLSLLYWVVGGLAVFMTIRAGIMFLGRELVMQTGLKIVRDVRRKMHAHLQRMPLQFLEDYQVGRIVSRIMGDTEAIKNLLNGGVINTVSNCLRLVFVAGVLIWIDWRLTLVSCFTMPFFTFGMVNLIRKLKPAHKELSEDRSRLWAKASETFSGMRVVKTYGSEKREDVDFASRIHTMLRKAMLMRRAHASVAIVWELCFWLGLVAMIGYGGHQVIVGAIRPGELVSFYALLGLLYNPIAELINTSEVVQAAMASIERIGEILDGVPETAGQKHARETGNLKGAVAFENVSFKYKETRKKKSFDEDDDENLLGLQKIQQRRHTLKNISFQVKPGECIALVGPSGAGKTTITSLLARFYELDGGAIKVDGHNVRDYKMDAYRRNLAIVLQDNFLFRGTIRENIAYASPDASEDAIVRAAKMAGAWDFIQESSDGLDTVCGERGVRLSGGQKQRLSIARAILADPRILILDEATSALDSQVEAQIQEALEKLMKGRTTFVIAHRLSTIVNADRIIVMNEGQIAEMGSHEELLSQKGHYFKMFMEQYGKVHFSGQTASMIAQHIEERIAEPGLATFIK